MAVRGTSVRCHSTWTTCRRVGSGSERYSYPPRHTPKCNLRRCLQGQHHEVTRLDARPQRPQLTGKVADESGILRTKYSLEDRNYLVPIFHGSEIRNIGPPTAGEPTVKCPRVTLTVLARTHYPCRCHGFPRSLVLTDGHITRGRGAARVICDHMIHNVGALRSRAVAPAVTRGNET